MKLEIKLSTLRKKDCEKKDFFFLTEEEITHSPAAALVGHSPFHTC